MALSHFVWSSLSGGLKKAGNLCKLMVGSFGVSAYPTLQPGAAHLKPMVRAEEQFSPVCIKDSKNSATKRFQCTTLLNFQTSFVNTMLTPAPFSQRQSIGFEIIFLLVYYSFLWD